MKNRADTSATGIVLVPLGLSAKDQETLCYAARIAEKANRTLLVFHAVHEPADQPGVYHRLQSCEMHVPLRDIAQRLMESRLAQARSKQPQNGALRDACFVVETGIPHSRIVEFAARSNASLIVMRADRRSKIDRLLHGSTTEAVKKHAPCPVLEAIPSEQGSVEVPAGVSSPLPGHSLADMRTPV